jgi:hypothetical protein
MSQIPDVELPDLLLVIAMKVPDPEVEFRSHL